MSSDASFRASPAIGVGSKINIGGLQLHAGLGPRRVSPELAGEATADAQIALGLGNPRSLWQHMTTSSWPCRAHRPHSITQPGNLADGSGTSRAPGHSGTSPKHPGQAHRPASLQKSSLVIACAVSSWLMRGCAAYLAARSLARYGRSSEQGYR